MTPTLEDRRPARLFLVQRRTRAVARELVVFVAAAAFVAGVAASPRQVTFGAVATPVKAKQAFVVTVTVEAPDAKDCTTEVVVTGTLRMADREALESRGACGSPDGRTFHVRFVPQVPGEYDWSVVYAQGDYVRTGHGSVTVIAE